LGCADGMPMPQGTPAPPPGAGPGAGPGRSDEERPPPDPHRPADAVAADQAAELLRELEELQEDLEGRMALGADPPASGGGQPCRAPRCQPAPVPLRELNEEIEEAQREVLFRLAEAVEGRSKETGSHVMRVADLSYVLALKSGIEETEAELLRMAAPMHDVGKVAIPDAILHKPGTLTPEEFAVMQRHTTLGYEILRGSKRRILQAAAVVALQHHEKYSGRGYPLGLKGQRISVYGRITGIADVFDALSFDRVYRRAWELDRILDLLRKERGESFDPSLIDIFLANLDQFLAIRDGFPGHWGDDARSSARTPIPANRSRGPLRRDTGLPVGPGAGRGASPHGGRPNLAPVWRSPSDPREGQAKVSAAHVLLAEPQPQLRGMMERALRRLGYETTTAGDGSQALAFLQEHTGPGLAILGPGLADGAGLAVCRQFRRLERTRYVYVILVSPQADRQASAEGLRAGADACLPAPVDPVELEAQLLAARRILDLEAELIGTRQSLREQAARDALTGLWNRPAILELFHAERARARREDSGLGVILSDVDHFRQINETYGLHVGDLILQAICGRMRSVTRAYDMTGRYGDGEFLSILPRCEATFARDVAERLRRRIADEPIAAAGASIAVTISLGVATERGAAEADGDSVIRAADLALCRAKCAGRNRVEIAPTSQ